MCLSRTVWSQFMIITDDRQQTDSTVPIPTHSLPAMSREKWTCWTERWTFTTPIQGIAIYGCVHWKIKITIAFQFTNLNICVSLTTRCSADICRLLCQCYINRHMLSHGTLVMEQIEAFVAVHFSTVRAMLSRTHSSWLSVYWMQDCLAFK